MNFFYLLLFFFLKFEKIINDNNDTDLPYKAFNDKFTSISISSENITDSSNHTITNNVTTIYSGTCLSYIKLNSIDFKNFTISKRDNMIDINITINNDNYSYSFNNETIKINCLFNKTFYFHEANDINNKNIVMLNFIENGNFVFFNYTGIDSFNISYCSDKTKIYISDGENLFIKYSFLASILVFMGCFSMLYGSYHYIFGLIPHCTFFIYFLFLDIFGIGLDLSIRIYSYILFSSFIASILFVIFIKTSILSFKNKNNVLKIFYGCFFGFSLYKILCYYYCFFGLPLLHHNLYFAILSIFIVSGIVINMCDLLGEYKYLPCAVVSGSFYVMKGLGYLIGGYVSDIIIMREGLQLNIENVVEYIVIQLILHILIIIVFVIYQIKHYKNEQTENEDVLNKDLYVPLKKDEPRDKNENENEKIKEIEEIKEKEEIKEREENKEKEEEEDDDIIDQED